MYKHLLVIKYQKMKLDYNINIDDLKYTPSTKYPIHTIINILFHFICFKY